MEELLLAELIGLVKNIRSIVIMGLVYYILSDWVKNYKKKK